MKAKLPYHMNKAQQEAFNAEVRRQLAEHLRVCEGDLWAMLLYHVHLVARWKKPGLTRLYKESKADFKELLNWYQFGKADESFLCRHKLKNECDIDIDELISGDMFDIDWH